MFRLLIVCILCIHTVAAQTKNAADILQDLKKLDVHGAVLYIAAHPDDENTRLLSYLANERKFRTGYLSLTRGDGGQNLIGDEQGIDLGLIRTQELLAARKVDGAEQFFSSAYDFGYSKSPDETFHKWNHQKILGEVVYVIRKFRPDVIITRFPTTGEGGHGHHTASAILAGEAFDAAADPAQFREQGLAPWKVKRLLWNTFNFGSANTQKEDQFKIDAGGYNPLLGISYGEMAAASRSNHKSQGFGVPAQRGTIIEYFATIKGQAPVNDLMDGIDVTATRYVLNDKAISTQYKETVNTLIQQFDPSQPFASIQKLQDLHDLVQRSGDELLMKKLSAIENCILHASGIFMEAISQNVIIAKGDSAKFNLVFNNRNGLEIEAASVNLFEEKFAFDVSQKNINSTKNINVFIPFEFENSQPYWLEQPLKEGSFSIDPQLTGLPQNVLSVNFSVTINGKTYGFKKPLQFKSTDPVKGEVYQSAVITDPLHLSVSPSLLILPETGNVTRQLNVTVSANENWNIPSQIGMVKNAMVTLVADTVASIKKGNLTIFNFPVASGTFPSHSTTEVSLQLSATSAPVQQHGFRKINYDHIPSIAYHYKPTVKIVKVDLKTEGKTAGYIAGAGDKVPEALIQMGYQVIMLAEQDLTYEKIKKLDVIITGIRAYNIHSWLSNAHAVLMKYVQDGGVLLVQYNTNNSIGPVKASISPYPFNISRNRITDEKAAVYFLIPDHPLLNYPNKITAADFEGWIQERSIYHADNIDEHYKKLFAMNDPNEQKNEGSLIVTDYGKGRFMYTGLVFFRELPAGVAGAYRLFANLIANKRK